MKVSKKTSNHLKEWLKVAGYTSLGLLLFMGISEATLEVETGKASAFTNEKLLPWIVGGAIGFGGAARCIQGKFGEGLSVVGTGVATGFGVSLAQSGTLFKLFG